MGSTGSCCLHQHQKTIGASSFRIVIPACKTKQCLKREDHSLNLCHHQTSVFCGHAEFILKVMQCILYLKSCFKIHFGNGRSWQGTL
jgi:hypothetical protein